MLEKGKNVIYVIENEHGDEGFIHYIDLNDNTLNDEVVGYSSTYNPEEGYHYNPISQEQYEAIFRLHAMYAETEEDSVYEQLQDMIAHVLKVSKQLKFK